MIRRWAVAAVGVAAIGVALACVAALVPVWPIALVVHFRVQWLVIGAVIAIAAMALRARAFAEVAAIATLIQLVAVAPDLGAERDAIPTSGDGAAVDPRGMGLEPARRIVWLSAERARALAGARRMAMHLDAEMLGARELVLVGFEIAPAQP